MKKLITLLFCSLLTSTAFAGPHRHNHHFHHRHHGHQLHNWHHNHGWVAPAIIGGVIGYSLARPYIVEQPVIIQQPQTIIPQYSLECTEWREIMLSDGRIVKERICKQ